MPTVLSLLHRTLLLIVFSISCFTQAIAAPTKPEAFSDATMPPYLLKLEKGWKGAVENKSPVHDQSFEEEFSFEKHALIFLPSASWHGGESDTTPAVLDEFANGVETRLSQRNAKIESKKSIKLDGMPAWYFVAENPSSAQSKQQMRTHFIVALDDCFVYHLVALYRAEHRSGAEAAIKRVIANWKRNTQPKHITASCKAQQ
jgi:hypothetical protein